MSKKCDILNIDDIKVSIIDDNNYNDISLLSLEEESELFNLYKGYDDKVSKNARDKIFYSNIRLVKELAYKYSTLLDLSYEDLFMEGCIGLVIAIDRFDVSTENKFCTYAYWWVRHFIISATKIQFNSMKVSVGFLNKVNEYKSAMAKYNKSFYEHSFSEYLNKTTDLKKNDINMIEKYLVDVCSLDAPPSKETDIPLREMIYDDIDVGKIVEDKIMFESFYDTVDEFMDKFKISERDRQIIYYRFGLGGYPVKTLEELQSMYSISHQRVWEIVNRFIRKVQNSKKSMNKMKCYIKN